MQKVSSKFSLEFGQISWWEGESSPEPKLYQEVFVTSKHLVSESRERVPFPKFPYTVESLKGVSSIVKLADGCWCLHLRLEHDFVRLKDYTETIRRGLLPEDIELSQGVRRIHPDAPHCLRHGKETVAMLHRLAERLQGHYNMSAVHHWFAGVNFALLKIDLFAQNAEAKEMFVPGKIIGLIQECAAPEAARVQYYDLCSN